jgi:hypothetical protein
MRFRTIFHDVDYIGQPIPADVFNLTGIISIISGLVVITARSLEDFNFDLSEYEHDIISFKNSLIGNYPNPFNPETTIRFSVTADMYQRGMPRPNTTVHVSIDVFNIRGQRVRGVVSGVFESGVHSVVWDGRDDRGNNVGSGVYFYQMRVGEFVETRRMVLIR